MIESFYENPWSMLAATFVLGNAVGLILAAWIIQIYWWCTLRTEKHNRAIQEGGALKALEEKPVEIDESRMLCAVCWEERHPAKHGLSYGLHNAVKSIKPQSQHTPWKRNTPSVTFNC